MTIEDIKAMDLKSIIMFVALELKTYNARRLRGILRRSGIEVDTKADRDTLLDKIIDLVIED